MFFGRHVAQHRGPVPSDHSGADRRGDVVVAGRDVRDQRPKRVERRFVAELFLFVHLLFDLVQRHVAGTLDHDLNVVLPRLLGQFTQSLKFGELGFVAGIGNAAGTQAVAQGERNVVFGENLADIVKALIQKILFVMVRHPLRQNRPAATDNPGDALRNHRKVLNEHSGMDGHVINALLGLFFDYLEHDVFVEIFNPLDPRDRLVDGHRADGHGRVAQDGFTNFMDVPARRQIHHSIGAEVHGCVQLLEFFLDVRGHGRVADVGINLAQRGHADAHGFEFGMIDIGGNNHPAARNFIANQFGRKLFTMRHVGHLIRDLPLARVAHLGEIAVGILGFSARDPLSAGFGNTLSVGAVGRSHCA